MYILGITHLDPYQYFTHDTSVALIKDGVVKYAAAEERFTRITRHGGFPALTLDWIFKEENITLSDIDHIAIPWGKLNERNLKSVSILKKMYLALSDFKKYIDKKRFHIDYTEEDLLKQGKVPKNIHRIDHQTAHASAAYRHSKWNEATVISLDGGGIDSGIFSAGAIFRGRGGNLERIFLIPQRGQSLGFFYGAVTMALGWRMADNEGKTMGLASYGDPKAAYRELSAIAPRVKGLDLFGPEIIINGGQTVNCRYCNFLGDRTKRFLQGLVKKHGRENIAAAAQLLLEERTLELIHNAVAHTGIKKVAAGGGIFLNVKLNKRILEAGYDLYVYPNAGDGGMAVGAALELYHNLTSRETIRLDDNIYLGPTFSDEEIEATLKKSGINYSRSSDICDDAAALLAGKNVIGWFQGRMEWGPRALGARSVLADPRDPQVKVRINDKLKRREWFMPFAPSVLKDYENDYIENPYLSPHMILAFDCKQATKDRIPAVIHVDDTIRPQVVEKHVNPLYYNLIKKFGDKTGVYVLLNTSFNRHGQSICCSPGDAIQHLKWGCIDYLVIGNFIASLK